MTYFKDLNAEEMIEHLLKHQTRREIILSKPIPNCPSCNHEQIQLVSWIDFPASWKCRMCKFKFNYEPK